MRRRHREEEERQAAATRSPPLAGNPILALQQTAGNHAVTRMITRKEGAKPAPASGPQADFGEGARTIPIKSFQSASPGSPGSLGPEKHIPQDVHFSSETGDHSPDLMRWHVEGRLFPEVLVKMPGGLVTLSGCLVASYNTSGAGGGDANPLENWTLSCQDIKFARDAEAGPQG